jgi:glycerophosphoryl diester phosphodiesterase
VTGQLRQESGKILVEAHAPRGIATLEAFQRLHDAGADLVEVDVQTTADGVVIVYHDYTIEEQAWVHELSAAQLGARHEVFHFEDVLVWARDVGAMLSVDVKSSFRPFLVSHRAVLHAVDRTCSSAHVVLGDWDHLAMRALKRERADVMTRIALRARPHDIGALVVATQADAVTLEWDLLQPHDVEVAHAHGAAVTLMSGWHVRFFRVAATHGVDVVSWGDPEEARQLLAEAASSIDD